MPNIKLRKFLIGSVYFILFLGIFIFAFSYFAYTNEDAWIAFKYARNLADGFGLVSNPGDVTQEGYSNLTFVLLITLSKKLFNIHPIYLAKAIGLASIFGLFIINYFSLKLIFKTVKDYLKNRGELIYDNFIENEEKYFHLINILIILGIGLSNYTVLWVMQGLETIFYSMIVLAVFYSTIYILLTQKYKYFYVPSILSFISLNTRPEGLMNFLLVLIIATYWGLLNKKEIKNMIRPIIKALALFVVLCGLLIIFKLWYFGDIVANPSYIKLAIGDMYTLSDKYSYVARYFGVKGTIFTILFVITFLIGAGAALFDLFKKKIGQISIIIFAILAFIGSQMFFIYFAGLDYMAHFRFIITHYPFFILIIILLPFFILVLKQPQKKYNILVNLAVIGIVGGLVIYSAFFNEKTGNQRWQQLDFVLPVKAYETLGTFQYKNAIILASKMRDSADYYATSEFGYIPYNVDSKGLDMIGLNQKEIARNFKYYNLQEALFANRDFILSKLPKTILVYGVKKEKDGFQNLPSVAWFLNPYFQSSFFSKNYDLKNIPMKFSDEWIFIDRNNNYNPTNIIKNGDKDNYDKFMYGFYIEEKPTEQIWISPLARVLIRPKSGDKYINIEGWIPDISLYPNHENIIEIKHNDKAVGDKLFAKKIIKESGDFKIKLKLDKSIFELDEDILLTLKANELDKKGSLDARNLSYIFKSIYFSSL